MKRTITTMSTLGAAALLACGVSACGSSSSDSADSKSSASKSPSESASPSASTSASSPAPGTSGKPTIDAESKSLVEDLAKKAGCAGAQAELNAGALPGVKAGARCSVGGNTIVMVAGADDALRTATSQLVAASKGKGVFYVEGDGWIGLQGKSGKDAAPTQADAAALQAKVGGEVKQAGS